MTELARRPCAAHGCIREGTQIASTNGQGEWWCNLHFGAAPHRLQAITAEIRRLDWLCALIDAVRHFNNTGVWTEAAASAYAQIKLKQRSDLLMLDGVAATISNPGRPPETHHQWLARLENELRRACAAPPDPQHPLDITEEQ